jgi:hypothetical protein
VDPGPHPVSERLRRWRWRIARRIAPEPIMADPCPGREAFVVQRTFGEHRTQLSVPLDTLDIDIQHEPVNLFGSNPDTTYFNNWRRHVTVTGTAES